MYYYKYFGSIGSIPEFLNKYNIKKEDIIYIGKDKRFKVLIYWKEI